MAEYIERGQAVAWFQAYLHMGEDSIPTEMVLSDLRYVIPKADVMPVRHGRWLDLDGEVYDCSACHEIHSSLKYNYCPDCGARMDGGADNASD